MSIRSGSIEPLQSLRDRRVVLVTTPRFGIVGQSQTVVYRVEDQGARPTLAEVTIRRDGEVLERRSVTPGNTVNAQIPIPHAGPNIVEIEASPLDGELTQVNNREFKVANVNAGASSCAASSRAPRTHRRVADSGRGAGGPRIGAPRKSPRS
jgi:hypothetical protein